MEGSDGILRRNDDERAVNLASYKGVHYARSNDEHFHSSLP